jgi:hypothetical protein
MAPVVTHATYQYSSFVDVLNAKHLWSTRFGELGAYHVDRPRGPGGRTGRLLDTQIRSPVPLALMADDDAHRYGPAPAAAY